MGVRYTNGPVIYQTSIPSGTSAALIAGIDDVLSECAIARASVTGGWKYTLQSPDTLQLKLWVQDLGDHSVDGSFIRLTPTSADELQTGQAQGIIYDGRTYEAWANQCQFFLAPAGDSGTVSFVSFACGVLALPANTSGPCAENGAVAVSELWWSSSSGSGGFGGNAPNFRNSRTAAGSFSLAYNGTLYVATGNGDPNPMELVPLCTAINVDGYLSPPSTFRYITGEGLRIDALLAQGSTVYGQLWDAHLLTCPATLDSTVTLTDIDSLGNPFLANWVCWSHNVPSDPTHGGGTILGTLFLLAGRPVTNSLANIAF